MKTTAAKEEKDHQFVYLNQEITAEFTKGVRDKYTTVGTIRTCLTCPKKWIVPKDPKLSIVELD